ncbi:MAG: acyltransferase [Bacteroides sp.]|nr:acyltransferase [Bacteroides sp.]
MKAKGRSMFYPNMNLLRYLLSLGILINHFNLLGGFSIPYFISHDRIGGFFVLSGFLMFHSYTKLNNLPRFAIHRARRILPTYIFIVILCAIAGVFLTTLPISRYIADPALWKYLAANLTFMNWLAPDLPGLFTGPEFRESAVNGSLWTMKVEWILDLSVPLFVLIMNRTRWKREYMAAVIILLSMAGHLYIDRLYEQTGNHIYEILGRQFITQMGFFYCGMLVYFLREKAERHLGAVISIGAILYIIGPFIPYGNVFIAPPAVALLFLGVSMIGRTINAFIHTNCISYNIFLVHWPVIQVCVGCGLTRYPVWISLGIILLTTTLLALFTNRFIDQPFSLRKTKS